MCHSARPTTRASTRRRRAWSSRPSTTLRRTCDQIMAQAVNGDAMPLGNETRMTRAERAELGAFLDEGKRARAEWPANAARPGWRSHVPRRGQPHVRRRLRRRLRRHRRALALGGRAGRDARGRSPIARAMVEAFLDAVVGRRRRRGARAPARPSGPRRARAMPASRDSRREQAGAGLDTLTPEEFARFTDAERRLPRDVRLPLHPRGEGRRQAPILAAFDAAHRRRPARPSSPTATRQVLRIIRFRIEDRVDGLTSDVTALGGARQAMIDALADDHAPSPAG